MSEMTIKREEGVTLLLPGSVGQAKPVTNSAAVVSTPEKTESSEKPGIIVPIVSATSQQKPVSSSCPKPKLHVSHAAVATAVQQRRSSTRSIKRKKFDDELVESSLMKSDRGRLKAPSVTEKADHQGSGQDSVTAAPPPEKKKTSIPPIEKKKPARSSTKRKQKPKVPVPASTKDLGRWKPQDDLALITAIQQTNDLMAVHLGVKFSCKFTLKEIQERWYALLYDPVISKLAVTCMKQLHPDIISSIQAKTLFSKSEEELLGRVTSTSQPTLEVFQDLLNKHASMFHPTRIAKALHNHWVLMKQYHLLPDQSIQPMPRGDHVLNFSDAEDLMNDDELREPRDEILENELGISDRRNKREIRHLEQELPKWQVLVDSVTGVSPPDFDNQTLAVLRGRLVRYLMRSREITLGRATRDNQIDVDLSLEGPAWKISRRQGVIKLRHNGDFFLANEGKRPIYIDGKPVLVGNKQKLNNNAVVEISCLRFIFLINQDLINVIRTEAQKMTGTWTTQA